MALMGSPDRHIHLQGCFNFRDIGGYPAGDGNRVRWGRVFRSGSLHRLDGAGLETAMGLGLRTVIDLRSSAELDRDGRFPAADAVSFHHAPIFEEEHLPLQPAGSGAANPSPSEEYMAMAGVGADSLRRALEVIAEGEHAVVFHCAAGKDRTGLVAALLLAALGVPDELILSDYQLSQSAVISWLEWSESNAPAEFEELTSLPPWLLEARVSTMEQFLEIVRRRHMSVEAYLSGIGVGTEVVTTLRDRLLE